MPDMNIHTMSKQERRSRAASLMKRVFALLMTPEEATDVAEQVATEVGPKSIAVETYCRSCGEDFTITPGEVEFLTARGLSLFKRCEACRSIRRNELAGAMTAQERVE